MLAEILWIANLAIVPVAHALMTSLDRDQVHLTLDSVSLRW